MRIQWPYHACADSGMQNFVRSYTDPKYVGLLMSPVADCDLKAFLERDHFPKDDLHLLRGFFGCLCSAVLYLHNSKCRHKDLKPGNILVYMNNVLITDFGTAHDWSEQSRSTTTGRSGTYTPGYAAPEVVYEEPRSSSADIWSLGCIYLDMMVELASNQVGA
jgi:serine/threonine protein kinase